MRYFSIALGVAMLIAAGTAYAQLTQTGAGKVAGGGGPPSACDGTIDLSTGCVQPMLR